MTLGISEEFNWGVNANCYAYACDCANPAVGVPPRQARPGVAGGAAPLNNGNVVQLTAGLVADGAVAVAGNPGAIPAAPANHYLIAMLTSGVGFHFIRHDPVTDRWSWKDANHGSVKLNVMDIPGNRFVYVNSGNLNDILVTNRGNYAWAYIGMNFQSFFAVPNAGLVVAG